MYTLYTLMDDRLIEGVTNAVKAVLTDGDIVVSNRYEYQGAAGDLGGMVVGRWRDEDVVVLVEAKHDMDWYTKKAKNGLKRSQLYWQQLVSDVIVDDDAMLADYRVLNVSKYKHHKVMFAFGGSKFSEEVASKFDDVSTPWFRVMANEEKGTFTASFMEKSKSQN